MQRMFILFLILFFQTRRRAMCALGELLFYIIKQTTNNANANTNTRF